MSDSRAAVLFPGQGAFSGAALKDVAAEYPQIAETLTKIDEVAKEQLNVSLTETLLGEEAPNIDELMKRSPDVLQLAIYATSMGLYRILETYGFQPTVLAAQRGRARSLALAAMTRPVAALTRAGDALGVRLVQPRRR